MMQRKYNFIIFPVLNLNFSAADIVNNLKEDRQYLWKKNPLFNALHLARGLWTHAWHVLWFHPVPDV